MLSKISISNTDVLAQRFVIFAITMDIVNSVFVILCSELFLIFSNETCGPKTMKEMPSPGSSKFNNRQNIFTYLSI